MAFDIAALTNLLNTGVEAYNAYNNSNQGSIFNPNSIGGIGSIIAGANQKEPGDVTEARQFLRNQFTSPNALTDQFTGQLNALSSEFQPYLD